MTDDMAAQDFRTSGRNLGKQVPASCLVYTPANLARVMVDALGTHSADRWLEPCVGKGALLAALSDAGVPSARVRGIDLRRDPETGDKLARVQRGVEFLAWSLHTTERFDKVIANPPYVALERLPSLIRKAALGINTLSDVSVGLGGNCWYAFLCASINLLRQSGSLCFLLPAAWDFANYADPLRAALPRFFARTEVYRSKQPLFRFSGVQEGAVILVARDYDPTGARKTNSLSHTQFDTVEELARNVKRAKSVAQPLGASPRQRPTRPNRDTANTVAFDTVFATSIGAVTGDVSYFLLTDDRRRELGLPAESCRPAISRARHLTASTIDTKQWELLRQSGERVWIFAPPPRLRKHPAIEKYLEWGEGGGCAVNNHKIAARSPWYQIPMPKAFDGFLSGMSGKGPWIAFRGMRRLTATNTLYGVSFRHQLDGSARHAMALGLLTSNARQQLSQVQRRYADGLLKWELTDLREIRLPIPPTDSSATSEYQRAVRALMLDDPSKATTIADAWFRSHL